MLSFENDFIYNLTTDVQAQPELSWKGIKNYPEPQSRKNHKKDVKNTSDGNKRVKQ